MLIIVEGCDGSGKTTLVESLKKQLEINNNVSILHKGAMKQDAFHEYVLPLAQYFPGNGEHIICDRWHVGELIYGPLLRKRSNINDDSRESIERFLRTKGALLIFLDTPIDTIKKRLTLRGDELITVDMVERIVQEYRVYFSSTYPTYCRTIRYHTGLVPLAHITSNTLVVAGLLESEAVMCQERAQV